jgi:hypothetical protein
MTKMKVKAACEVHGVYPREVMGGKPYNSSFTSHQGRRPQGNHEAATSYRKELQGEIEILTRQNSLSCRQLQQLMTTEFCESD